MKSKLFTVSFSNIRIRMSKLFVVLLMPFILAAQSGYWMHTNEGPYYRISSFTFDDGTVFTCGDGGIFRSTNGGKFWSRLNYNFNFYSVKCMVIDSLGNMYAGTTGGLYFSSDQGITWTEKDSSMGRINVHALIFSPDGSLLAGTSGPAIFASTDKADTWKKITTFPIGASVSSLLLTNTGYILAGITGATWIEKTQSNYDSIRIGGIYRSTDGGISWDIVYIGVVNETWGTPTYQLVTALCKSANGLLYAGVKNLWSLYEGSVLVSQDDGKNWTMTPLKQPVSSLTSDSSGIILAATPSAGLFRSTDGGWEWMKISDALEPVLATDHQNKVWAASSGLGGITITNDHGNSWERASTGLMNPNVYCLAFNSHGTLFAGTQGGGIPWTTDYGDTWVRYDSIVWDWIGAITATDNGGILASGNSFYKSIDDGHSWQTIEFPRPNFYVYSFCRNGSGEILAASNQGVFSSATNGESWTPLLENTLTNYSVLTNTDGWIYVGLDTGIVRSTDRGASWLGINNGLSNKSVRVLAMLPEGKLFAGTWGGGIFQSTNKGETWLECNSGLTGQYIQSFAVNGLGHIFAGVPGGGVCRSKDNGSTWEAVNSGLTFINNMSALAVGPNGNIFAGTLARGVFRSVNSTLSAHEIHSSFPFAVELAQNYPNPFNPVTTIRYQIAFTGQVTLKLFDLLGREISTLVNETKYPGAYNVVWDASKFPSGVYFYELKTGHNGLVKKMLLLK